MYSTGKIYMITNNTDGKSYIGQTTRPIEVRVRRHIMDSKSGTSNLVFHRALNKYGVENFDVRILEDGISSENLDQKEIYYISQYNTFYLNENGGYNMTAGGKDGSCARRILSDDDINNIKNSLRNTDIQITEIAENFEVSISCISDINRGKTWHDPNIQYPIRSTITPNYIECRDVMDIENFLMYCERLSDVISIITEKYNISSDVVRSINKGIHPYSNRSLYFPITPSDPSDANKLKEKDIKDIIFYILFTDRTYSQISQVFNVERNAIAVISEGKAWREYTSQYIFPLRQNVEENQKRFIV